MSLDRSPSLAVTARVLLGLVATAVLGFALSARAGRDLFEHGTETELTIVDATSVPMDRLTGTFQGTDSMLRLEDSGRYEYSGAYSNDNGYGCLRIPSTWSSGTWRRDSGEIELSPETVDSDEEEAAGPVRLVVWQDEGALGLTPRSAGFLVHDLLRRAEEPHR